MREVATGPMLRAREREREGAAAGGEAGAAEGEVDAWS